MQRLAQFDVSTRIKHRGARLAVRLAFGLACALGMIAVRLTIDIWVPGTGPFALLYPAVLLATLYGRWEAGAAAYATGLLWSWIQVMPLTSVLIAGEPLGFSRVALNAVSALIVLLFAETFRRAVETARQQSEAEIERRAVLLAELEHRTKNNFALVASLLELQKRREESEPIRRAFDDAIGRVRTFAEAYTHLAGEQGEGVMVEMRPYLERLVARVSSAMLPPQVTISARFDEVSLRREAAVAIGLFANEALTNCAKYAFPDGRPGVVEMIFEAEQESWRLTIRDNGLGEAAQAPQHSGGGIGTQLLEAFARQAGARHATNYDCTGCEVSLVHEDEAA